eukprot:2240853-Amphidinium_carterae.2
MTRLLSSTFVRCISDYVSSKVAQTQQLSTYREIRVASGFHEEAHQRLCGGCIWFVTLCLHSSMDARLGMKPHQPILPGRCRQQRNCNDHEAVAAEDDAITDADSAGEGQPVQCELKCHACRPDAADHSAEILCCHTNSSNSNAAHVVFQSVLV